MPRVELEYNITDGGTIGVLDRVSGKIREVNTAAAELGQAGAAGLDEVRTSGTELASTMGTVASAFGSTTLKMAAGLGTAAGAALAVRSAIRGVFDIIESRDSVTKLARAVGVSVTELSSLTTAAELSNVSMELLGRGLNTLTVGIGKSASGVGDAESILASLGITVRDSVTGNLRSALPVLLDFAEWFSQQPNEFARTNALLQVFGQRVGPQLASFLNEGRDGLEQLILQNDKFGRSLTEVQGEQAERAMDAMARMSLQFQSLGIAATNFLVGPFADGLEAIQEYFGLIESAANSPTFLKLFERQQEVIGILGSKTTIFLPGQREKLLAEKAVLDDLLNKVAVQTGRGNKRKESVPGALVDPQQAQRTAEEARAFELAHNPAAKYAADLEKIANLQGVLSGDTIKLALAEAKAEFERATAPPKVAGAGRTRRTATGREAVPPEINDTSLLLGQNALKIEERRLDFLREDLSLSGKRNASDTELLAIAGQIDDAERGILERKRETLIAAAQFATATNASGREVLQLRGEIDLVNAELARGPDNVAELTAELAGAKKEASAFSQELSRGVRTSVDALIENNGDFNLLEIGEGLGKSLAGGLLDGFLQTAIFGAESQKGLPNLFNELFGVALPEAIGGGFRAGQDAFRVGVGGLTTLAQRTQFDFARLLGFGQSAQQLSGAQFGGTGVGGLTASSTFSAAPTTTQGLGALGFGALQSGAQPGVTGGAGGAGAGIGAAAGAAGLVLAAVLPLLDAQNDRRRITQTTGGLSLDTTESSSIGFGQAVGAGASIGAIGGVYGVVIGAAVGAIVALVSKAFEQAPTRGSVLGKSLDEFVNETLPLYARQRSVSEGGNSGLLGGHLDRSPTVEDRTRFVSLGFESFGGSQTAQGDQLRDNNDDFGFLFAKLQASQSPASVNDLRFSEALALGGILGDKPEDAPRLANRIITNAQLLSLSEDETKRQLRGLADATGLGLGGSIEALNRNYLQERSRLLQPVSRNLGEGRFEYTVSPPSGPELVALQDQLATGVEGLIKLFSEDIPKGVNVQGLVDAATNATTGAIEIGALFEQLEKDVNLFGDLADKLNDGLRTATEGFVIAPSGASILEGGGSVADAIRAQVDRDFGLTSALIDTIGGGISVAISEGVFNAVEDSATWQALTTKIADSIAAGTAGTDLAGLIGATLAENLPALDAAQQLNQQFREQLGLTPTSLQAEADQIGDRADALRFGALTPKQQLAQLEAEKALLLGRRENILEGGITQEEAPEFARIAREIAGVGEQIYGVAGQVFSGGGVANQRRLSATQAEGLSLQDKASADLARMAREHNDRMRDNTNATLDLTAATRQSAEATAALVKVILSDPGQRAGLLTALRTDPEARRAIYRAAHTRG